MNIWKITHPTSDGRVLVAIVVALNPAAAKALVAQTPEYAIALEPPLCSQLGYAATNLRTPSIILLAIKTKVSP